MKPSYNRHRELFVRLSRSGAQHVLLIFWTIFAGGFCSRLSGQDESSNHPLANIAMAPPTPQPNGARVQTPLNRPVSRRNGIALAIDTRWANNYGYRSIEVVVTAAKPSKVDRLITIRLYSGSTGTISVEQSFVLPGGSTTASTTVAFPQYQRNAMTYFWWDVWVDGIKDKDLSLDQQSAAGWGWGGVGTGSSFLVAGPAAQRRSLVVPTTGEFEVLSLPLSEFPTRWIEYSCLDVVALTLADLQALSQSHPTAFTALSRWVRAGGQLWVGDAGAQLEQIPQISKLLRLSESVVGDSGFRGEPNSTESGEAVDINLPPNTGWRPVRFRNGIHVGQVVTFLDINTGMTRTVRDPQDIQRLQGNPQFVITNQAFEEVEQEHRRRVARDSSAWFVEQQLGMGRVRAFRGPNEITVFPQIPVSASTNAAAGNQDLPQFPGALAAALRSTSRWEARHGLTPDDANLDFANLLVPGVGLAPVSEFRILITLFVLLIGPVNYWLLKRWNRLHLLVLTVPFAALFMTVALLAYAIVSDGFGTSVRAHSFTSLDQRTGEAVCWTRLSYYSGLAPGDGLEMPNDAVLYPIIPGWNESMVDATLGVHRDMVWTDHAVLLTRGWLRSRKPTQYLTVRARNSSSRLELASGQDKMRAENRLGTAIQYVLVLDEAGKLWSGENLADGAIHFLEPAERIDAIRQLRKLATANEPQAPLALNDSDVDVLQRRQRRRMYRSRFGLQYSQARLSDSLVRGALDDLLGLSGQAALSLPPRSYIAITTKGTEVEYGMRGVEEVDSFHIVLGQW